MILINRKIALLLSAIIIPVIILVGIFAAFKTFSQNTKYDLQLGTEQHDEFPKMVDHGTEFKNDATLTAMAIFPDGDKKKNLLRAQLFVTRKDETTVLQKEDIRVYFDLAAYPMRLENLQWPSGAYTLYFKLGLEIEKSMDFILK